MALRPCFLIDTLLQKPSATAATTTSSSPRHELEEEPDELLKRSPSTSSAPGASEEGDVDESEEDEEPSQLSQLISSIMDKNESASSIVQRPILPITNPLEYLSKLQFMQQALSMTAMGLRPPFPPPPMMPMIRKECLFPRPSLPRPPRAVGEPSRNGKKYRCDVCDKTFSRSNTLITHKRIHTGEKPFKCEHCGRAFRQPGNLTRHRLTHTTVKPYVCAHCDKAFNRASNLHTHMRTHTGK